MGGFAVGSVVMLTDKNDLLRPLKALAAFDKGSPYVSVQLAHGGTKPQFYRSSAFGFMRTKDFAPDVDVIHVSLTHLIDCLRNLPEEAVELGADANGIMRIFGTSSDVFESESHVLTVSSGMAQGFKHDTGETVIKIDPNVFAGIDVRPFDYSTPPVLAAGRLMISTKSAATIVWTGPESIATVPELYPRDTFLRSIAGGVLVEELGLTENGYWSAVTGELVTQIKGHMIGRQLFDTYNAPVAQEIAKLPAERLMVGLSAAVGLLEPGEKVEIDPRLGVLAKGKFGDNRNSLGETGTWTRFGLMAKTAEVVYDALRQTPEDEATLYSTGAPNTLRLRRGPFEVNFRIF